MKAVNKALVLIGWLFLFGCEYKNLDLPRVEFSPPPLGEILKDTTCITGPVSTLNILPFANAFLQNIPWKYGEQTAMGDTVLFALIANQTDYENYVGFKQGQTRPSIDFSKYNLVGYSLLALKCVSYKNSTLEYGCDGYVYSITYWRGNCDEVVVASNLSLVEKPDLQIKYRLKYQN